MSIDYEWVGQVSVSLILAGIIGLVILGLAEFHRRGMDRVRNSK